MFSVREDLFTPSLGRGWSPHQICPCLGSRFDNTDSNDAIARKVDWFGLQCSSVCWNHKISRQVQVAGELFLKLLLWFQVEPI